MRWADRASLLWQRFSPLEKRLLGAARTVLSAEARRIFDAQVEAITLVQRHPRWTVIAFHRRRHGRVSWDGVPLFPRDGALPLAEIRFDANGRAFTARLTAYGGHLSDFAITPSPRDAAFCAWEGEPRARALADPLDVSASAPIEPVPESWRAFRAESQRTVADGWMLHGDGDVYRLTRDDGEFLVLAERDGGSFLLYRLEPSPPAFFVQLGHDSSPEPLRGDFARLLGATP